MDKKKLYLQINLALIAFVVLISVFKIFDNFDARLRDSIFQKDGSFYESDLIIVSIDDASLDNIGKWPWKRTVFAEFLEKLIEVDPAAVGIDIMFVEQSNPEDDAKFENVLKSTDRIVLPLFSTIDAMEEDGTCVATKTTYPYSAFADNATLGSINAVTDKDGLLRHAYHYYKADNKVIYSFSWEIYKKYQEYLGLEVSDNVKLDKNKVFPIRYTKGATVQLSTNPDNFDGKFEQDNKELQKSLQAEVEDLSRIETISFHKLYSGEIPYEYLSGRIVLIGPTATGIVNDYYYTPLTPRFQMFGIEVQANIIQQYIDNIYFTELSLMFNMVLLVLLGIIQTLIYKIDNQRKNTIAFLLMLVFMLSITYFCREYHIIIKPLPFIILFVLQYILTIVFSYLNELFEKRKIKSLFSKYMSPEVIEGLLVEGNLKVELGGIRSYISVLFVDIRGFTPLSESVEPEKVVAILNDYLTLCAKSIFDYGGTLDKYIGDAAMALYNTPLELEDHSFRAVQSAWAMHLGSVALNEELFKKTGKTISFGVGINTGYAIVGNIGADFRMDYTAIGDTVNTAARIESNAKPSQILISEAVYEVVKDKIEATDLGYIQVKGKVNGVRVYQVDNVPDMTPVRSIK